MTNDHKVMWYFDIGFKSISTVDDFQLPDNSVPLDFDGSRLVWLKHRKYT